MGIAKKIIVKRTFKDYISNLDNQNSKIKFEINIIKNHLQKYSNSNYNEASWLIRSKKSVDKSISFKNYMEFGENIVELIKLFTIFKLNENKSDFSFIKELKSSFLILKNNNIEIFNLNTKTFGLNYINYLQESTYTSSVKHKTFNTFQQLLFYMNGHPYLGNLDGIEQIINPFKKVINNGYKVIDTEILVFLDNYFLQKDAPIQITTIYWILRLFATRPDETINFPLNCATKLNNDIAIMRTYIGKKTHKEKEDEKGKYHDFIYLDLNNQYMRNLFDLVKKQEIIAQELQPYVSKLNYLFTYTPVLINGGKAKPRVLSTATLEKFFRDLQRNNNIPENKRARPRDFKKTGITQRAEFGFNHFDLKEIANHKSFDSIDSYSSCSDGFLLKKQTDILSLEKKMGDKYMFKGKIVNGMNSDLEIRIMNNPRAHKLPDMGYCPDVNHCGNHFECLGCNNLIPDKDLENYYFEQACFYLEKTKNQEVIGDKINARDNLHRATLFNQLWQKVKKV